MQIIIALLGAALVVLKLLGLIQLSWLWVTLPFWAGLAIALIILLGVGLAALIAAWLYHRKTAQAKKRRAF